MGFKWDTIEREKTLRRRPLGKYLFEWEKGEGKYGGMKSLPYIPVTVYKTIPMRSKGVVVAARRHARKAGQHRQQRDDRQARDHRARLHDGA